MSTHDPEETPLSPAEEQVAKEELEAALAEFEGIAPPELLQTMREIGMDAARTHPTVRRLLTAAASRPVQAKSGDLPTGASGARDGRRRGGEGA